MWPFKPKKQKALQAADDSTGWTRVFDWMPNAWQADSAYGTSDSVLAHSAVFACVSLISGDIAKLRPTLRRRTGKIWQEVALVDHPVLRKPNPYETTLRFQQRWIQSKLTHGNAYALKERQGGQVVALHLIDPSKVKPLISDGGQVFYEIQQTRLAGVTEPVTVPAREVVHDRWNCLHHPLVGLPPIYAAATAARVGLTLEGNSKTFFANASSPGGVLSAPGPISEATATRLKQDWNARFKGDNLGGVAIAGDGLKFEAMRMSNLDAQVIEHLKWSAETVCSVFHVPGHMVGVGKTPTSNNVEAVTTAYYSGCLQILIEDMEAALDEALRIPDGERVQLDLDGLFRLDSHTQHESLARAVGAGIMAPDEARRKLNLPSVPGGQYPYLQQQNYSLEALAMRDDPSVDMDEVARGQIAQLKQELQTATDEVERLAYDYDRARKQVDRARDQLADTRAELEAKHAAETQDLRQELARTEAELDLEYTTRLRLEKERHQG